MQTLDPASLNTQRKENENMKVAPLLGARIARVIALGYGLDDRKFESREGLGILLFVNVSRPPLGPPSLLNNE
jgi:hypothetical protein